MSTFYLISYPLRLTPGWCCISRVNLNWAWLAARLLIHSMTNWGARVVINNWFLSTNSFTPGTPGVQASRDSRYHPPILQYHTMFVLWPASFTHLCTECDVQHSHVTNWHFLWQNYISKLDWHTYMHTYVHTYIHTDIHTYMCIPKMQLKGPA